MTLQAPLHLQRRRLIRNRHVIDSSVAGRTADAFVHVNAVIEVCVIRQIVYANPLDRLACAKAGAHRFEIWTVGPDLFVATHTHGRGRHPCGSRRFNGRVTVAAIDAVVADVMFVTELNGLLAFDPLSGVPGGTIEFDRDPQQCDSNKNGAIDRYLRQRVCTVMEDLGHLPVS
jgi:hypothetical protein